MKKPVIGLARLELKNDEELERAEPPSRVIPLRPGRAKPRVRGDERAREVKSPAHGTGSA